MLTATLGPDRLALAVGIPNAVTVTPEVFADTARADLRCPTCGGRVHYRQLQRNDLTGAYDIKWTIFAHNPGEAERCRQLGGGESPAHDYLKRSIAYHALRNGYHADIEVVHADLCRSDVVIGTGNERHGIEIQMAHATIATIEERHQRYADALGSDRNVLWLTSGRRIWGDICRAEITGDPTNGYAIVTKVFGDMEGTTPAIRQHEPAEEFALRRHRTELDWIMDDGAGWWVDRRELRDKAAAARRTRRRSRRVTAAERYAPNRTEDCERAGSVDVLDQIANESWERLSQLGEITVCGICEQPSIDGEHPNCVNPPGSIVEHDLRSLSDADLAALFAPRSTDRPERRYRCLTCQGKGWRLRSRERCRRCDGIGLLTYERNNQ